MSISVVINTLNEESVIARCLDSVSWADEIIVVDMFSEDSTVEIANKYKAKTYTYPRSGYVEPARNFAISKACGDWVLVLDADETIPSSLARHLQEFVQSAQAEQFVGLSLPRKNIIFGRWIKHTGWWPDRIIRFFRKDKVRWSDRIHSTPSYDGPICEAIAMEDLAIVHHSYRDIAEFVARSNRYTTIEAQQAISDKRRSTILRLAIKPLKHFVDRYFVKRGFLDGYHGLVLSVLIAYYHFLVEAKVMIYSLNSDG